MLYAIERNNKRTLSVSAMAFHRCLGVHVAQIEGRVALEEMMAVAPATSPRRWSGLLHHHDLFLLRPLDLGYGPLMVLGVLNTSTGGNASPMVKFRHGT